MAFCHLQGSLEINMNKSARYLIGNKIVDKITSVGKTKRKKIMKQIKKNEIYIPPEKRQQIIDDLRLF